MRAKATKIYKKLGAVTPVAAKAEAYREPTRGRQRPRWPVSGHALGAHRIVPGDDRCSIGSGERRQRRSHPRQARLAM